MSTEKTPPAPPPDTDTGRDTRTGRGPCDPGAVAQFPAGLTFVNCMAMDVMNYGLRVGQKPTWLFPANAGRADLAWPTDFAAWVAAPFWTITWMFTFGRFGWPIWQVRRTVADLEER